jgi:hypothetical protein
MQIRKKGDEIKKKSSPLKILSQSQPNFAEMILGWFSSKIVAETKILTTSQTKNAQARRTSSFWIFTSPRPILLASGTGPPTNFEDWML